MRKGCVRFGMRASELGELLQWLRYDDSTYTLGHFTCWISLSLSVSLSPKFGLKPKISQKVKSFFCLRPNFGLSDR